MKQGTSFKPEKSRDSQVEKSGDEEWGLLTRIAFRFCFCYLLPVGLSCTFIFAEVTFRHSHVALWKFYSLDPWMKVLPWIFRHVFNVQRELRIYPDSDILSGYLQHVFELMVALVGTVAWSLLDRRHKNYRRLYGWSPCIFVSAFPSRSATMPSTRSFPTRSAR